MLLVSIIGICWSVVEEVARTSASYGRASQAVVWVGPATEDSTLAVESLPVVADEIQYDGLSNPIGTIVGPWTRGLEKDPCKILQ